MRARRGAELGPHLAWRVRLFSGAAILVVVGMYSKLNWLIWGAIALLAVAFLLRFLPDSNAAANADGEVVPEESPDAAGDHASDNDDCPEAS